MSTLGAIFGPTKYGLLPELLPESKLSWGNGIIEFGTLLAAILAALAGGYLAHVFHGRQVWSGVIFMVLAVVGLLISLGISRVPPADPGRKFDWNVPREFFSEVRHMSGDRPLLTAVVANTFFWFLGSLLLLNIVLYGADILHLDETRSSYLLAGLSMGIGLGSLAAGFVSGKKIQMGMVLPGLAGILLMAALLSWPGIGFGSVLLLLDPARIRGGLFCRAYQCAHPAAPGGDRERPNYRGGEYAVVHWGGAAAGGAVRDVEAGASGSIEGVSDRRRHVRGDGAGFSADVA